jgi:hypothetical protein
MAKDDLVIIKQYEDYRSYITIVLSANPKDKAFVLSFKGMHIDTRTGKAPAENLSSKAYKKHVVDNRILSHHSMKKLSHALLAFEDAVFSLFQNKLQISENLVEHCNKYPALKRQASMRRNVQL